MEDCVLTICNQNQFPSTVNLFARCPYLFTRDYCSLSLRLKLTEVNEVYCTVCLSHFVGCLWIVLYTMETCSTFAHTTYRSYPPPPPHPQLQSAYTHRAILWKLRDFFSWLAYTEDSNFFSGLVFYTIQKPQIILYSTDNTDIIDTKMWVTGLQTVWFALVRSKPNTL